MLFSATESRSIRGSSACGATPQRHPPKGGFDLDAGYNVEKALTGESGLRSIASVEPDLVLLDYMLPDANGLEVLRKIRKSDRSIPNIKLAGNQM
jgi:CheY-like chemotaxis protein